MGAERKRGKLAEFNRLLRGATDTSFVVQHGETAILPSVRYVITLDSDTQLPMEAARRLVGTLSHPLNRPRFDARRSASPKATASCSRASASASSAPTGRCSPACFRGTSASIPTRRPCPTSIRTCSTKAATSARGSTTWTRSRRRSPDACRKTRCSATICSKASTRAPGSSPTLTWSTTIPAATSRISARQHRWVRGDWQIARWLWRTVPDAAGRTVANTLPLISRWKILDNLRRSLIAAGRS